MMNIEDLLKEFAQRGGSDLYLIPGNSPMVRLEGKVVSTGKPLLAAEDTNNLSSQIMNKAQKEVFGLRGQINLAYQDPESERFRVNIYRQKDTTALVIRRVKRKIPTIDKLNLPKILEELSREQRGLILVTGPTGCGKSSTLAAMIEHRNSERDGHIVTIEDPIEFLHHSKKSIISQREIETDVKSFSDGLRDALRQAPDVILIGEMRDEESAQQAIYFAETGHLVLSTLHSTNASQTLERILQFFPADRHPQILMLLSLNLKAIISQRLVWGDKDKRIPAVEIMIATPYIRDLIQEGNITEIKSAIEEGTEDGMQTFNQHLFELCKEGKIIHDEALSTSDSPRKLKLKVRNLPQDIREDDG